MFCVSQDQTQIWPVFCVYHDQTQIWPVFCVSQDKTLMWPVFCVYQDQTQIWPVFCVYRDQTQIWPVFCVYQDQTQMWPLFCVYQDQTQMWPVFCVYQDLTQLLARVFSCFWDVIFSGHSYSYLLRVGQKCSSIVRLFDWLWMLLFSQQAFFSTQRIKPCWQVSSSHDHKQAKVIVMKMEEDVCDEYVKFVCLSAQKGSTINNKECLST